MIISTMSDNADFSVWSNDEVDILDNLEKEVRLVSSGSESDSNQVNHLNGEVWKVLQENDGDICNDSLKLRQSDKSPHQKVYLNEISNTQLDNHNLKQHYSSNDILRLSVENAPQSDLVPKDVITFNHSICCSSLSQNAHADGKFKKKFCVDGRKGMNEEKVGTDQKAEYLEEINKRLEKELEEKNALLSKLQENYENLLLKYAEAQNKIDQLRLKSSCKSGECQNRSGCEQIFARTNHPPLGTAYPGRRTERRDSWEEAKCQKAVVAPFMKDEQYQERAEVKIERPSSLPLDGTPKDAIKAGTPTDSEGVSSVITSMSGHSKILNTLDTHSPNSKDSKLNYPERDFILGESSVVKDAFDKVKNWQNSLPPLELIETPETTLYDESPVHVPPSPDSASPNEGRKAEGDYENRSSEERLIRGEDEDDDESQAVFKEYLRTLSLPSALKKRNPPRYPKRSPAADGYAPGKENGQKPSPKDDIPSGCIIQRRKKPPLLRCSSLPAYECDSPKSSNRNVYIPPLDLESLTLSDAESTQYEEYKGNRMTSSSYMTSQSGSMEFPSYRNNYKTRSDYADPQHPPKPSFNKSTSITPDRCNEMNFQPEAKSLCKVCGENFAGRDPFQRFPFRSSSYQSFRDVPDSASKSSSERRGKHPFNRSVSFNSENRLCSDHDIRFRHGRSHDSLEKFDVYTSNLKARSQVIMKALAAHVNNT